MDKGEYTIDLHCHTRNSDGLNSMYEMAEKAKELGRSALVVTDHDSKGSGAYFRNLTEAKVLSEHHPVPLPIIVGSEIRTPFGELLLFGKRAIKLWHLYREKLFFINEKFDINLWVHVFKERVLTKCKYNIGGGSIFSRVSQKDPLAYGLVVPHPRFHPDFVNTWPQEFCDLLHGFEVQNGDRDFVTMPRSVNGEGDPEDYGPATIAELRTKLGPCAELRNTDSHHKDSMGTCCNYTNRPIKSENDLIKWLNSFSK